MQTEAGRHWSTDSRWLNCTERHWNPAVITYNCRAYAFFLDMSALHLRAAWLCFLLWQCTHTIYKVQQGTSSTQTGAVRLRPAQCPGLTLVPVALGPHPLRWVKKWWKPHTLVYISGNKLLHNTGATLLNTWHDAALHEYLRFPKVC